MSIGEKVGSSFITVPSTSVGLLLRDFNFTKRSLTASGIQTIFRLGFLFSQSNAKFLAALATLLASLPPSHSKFRLIFSALSCNAVLDSLREPSPDILLPDSSCITNHFSWTYPSSVESTDKGWWVTELTRTATLTSNFPAATIWANNATPFLTSWGQFSSWSNSAISLSDRRCLLPCRIAATSASCRSAPTIRRILPPCSRKAVYPCEAAAKEVERK